MIKKLLLSSLLTILSVSLFAQLNLQVGYNGAYFQPEVTNKILVDFDANNPDWDNPLGEVKWMTGLVAGLNYRIDDLGLSLTWYNQNNTPKASGTINDEEQFLDLFIRNNSYSFGVQGYLDFFSVGAAIEYQNFVVKSEDTAMTERTTIVNENTFAGRVFLDFALARGAVSAIHIRPYVQFPFNEINVFTLEQALNPEAAINSNAADFNEKLMHFGISLYFSNGEQQ